MPAETAGGQPKLSRILVLLSVLLALTACTRGIAGEPFYDPAKPHHGPEGFRNPLGSPERDIGIFRFVRFALGRIFHRNDPAAVPAGHVLEKGAARKQLASAPAARLTWIGHVTYLIGIDGVNILTDPFFSDIASPLSFIGPRRYVPPGLEIADLPSIDVIVISHNHYDSYDLPSLRKLAARRGDTLVLVPLGAGALVRESGFDNVREVDWYDENLIGGIRITSTPAIHSSNRGPFDRRLSLWTGYLIAGKNLRIWFSGDTATGPVFDQVRVKTGGADIALVPIGAFKPRDFMGAVHAEPEEAAEIARVMGAKIAIGGHWGTLPLGEDLPREGRDRFLAAKLPGLANRVMRIGETFDLKKLIANSANR